MCTTSFFLVLRRGRGRSQFELTVVKTNYFAGRYASGILLGRPLEHAYPKGMRNVGARRTAILFLFLLSASPVWAPPCNIGALAPAHVASKTEIHRWLQTATLDELANQNAKFLETIAPHGKILPAYTKLFSQAEVDFLLSDRRNLVRASDRDRFTYGEHDALPRTLDHQTETEAEAMTLAEQTGQLPTPVTRSQKPHCDTRAGTGKALRDYSMKAVIEDLPRVDKPKDNLYERSTRRVEEEIGKLSLQSTDLSATQLTHLFVDFHRMKNPSLIWKSLTLFRWEIAKVNLERPASSQIELRFVLPKGLKNVSPPHQI